MLSAAAVAPPSSALADKKLRVSFCVPTYNRLATLAEAVGSILAVKGLEEADYEILVSDDSDNDRTKEYVLGLASSNGRVKYLKNAVKGQFNNLNNLIANARSSWIVFLHDDDKLHPDYLASVFPEGAGEDASVDIIWTGRRYVDDQGNGIKTRCARQNGEQRVVLNGGGYFEQMLSKNNYTYFGSVVPPMVTGLAVKKDVILKSGSFVNDFEVNGDCLFLWKVFFFSDKVAYVNKPLLDYRLGDDTERAKPSRKGIIFSEMKRLLATLLDFLKPSLSAADHQEKKKEYESNFYRNALNVNGPILWTALRFDGGYSKRAAIQLGIFSTCIAAVPASALRPTVWLVLFVSFLPQAFLKVLYKIYNREVFVAP